MLQKSQNEALKLHDELQRVKDEYNTLQKDADQKLLDEKQKVKTVSGIDVLFSVQIFCLQLFVVRGPLTLLDLQPTIKDVPLLYLYGDLVLSFRLYRSR